MMRLVTDDEDTYAQLWARVEEAWDEDKRHQAFLAYCRETGQLAEAARRYRAVVQTEGEDEALEARRAIARKRLDAITALAFASLDTEKSSADTSGAQRAIRVVAFLFLLGATVALIYGLAYGGRR